MTPSPMQPSDANGQTALKVIIIVGIAAFVCMILVAVAMQNAFSTSERERPDKRPPQSPFDGQRAFEDLQAMVELGPRPSGSQALEECRRHIRRELSMAGIEVQELRFEAATPLGPMELVNIVGAVRGFRPEVIILGAHYETEHSADVPLVGANSAGAATAWLIEMARALGAERQGRNVWLCFFDGSAPFAEEDRGLYGSRQFVEHLRTTGAMENVQAMIGIDMIGDRYLGIQRDYGAPQWLTSAIWSRASGLAFSRHFQTKGGEWPGDHSPFRAAGVPAVSIADRQYGGSVLEHQRNWHTANDTIERVCPESLQVIGDVVFHALPDIEMHLDVHGPG